MSSGKDEKCNCVTSRLFPHRKSKCTMKSTGAKAAAVAAITATTVAVAAMVAAYGEDDADYPSSEDESEYVRDSIVATAQVIPVNLQSKANTVFTFGRHKGGTFEAVTKNDLDFVSWALHGPYRRKGREVSPYGQMLDYIEYLTKELNMT